MAIEIIDLGTVPLDGSDGDVAREAFEKVNANFAEHESEIDALTPRVITLENEVGQLEIQAGQIQGDLTNLTESFNVLSSEVGGNTTDIQNLENSREYTLTPGTGITIDRTDPSSPVISSTGSSGSVWGQITGDISNQIDLFDLLEENNSNLEIVEEKVDRILDDDAVDKGAGAVPYNEGYEYPAGSVGSAIRAGSQLREDLSNYANPELGASLVGRSVVSVASIKDLLLARPDQSQLFRVRSYHTTAAYAGAAVVAPQGGREFFWNPTRLKSNHDGIKIVSPTVPWDGQYSTLLAFQTGTGESSPTGAGCWEMINHDCIDVADAGAVGDGVLIEDRVIQNAINAVPAGGKLTTHRPGATYLMDIPSQVGKFKQALLINKPMTFEGIRSARLRLKPFTTAWSEMANGDVITMIRTLTSGAVIDGLVLDPDADHHYETDGSGFKWWETGPNLRRPPDAINVSCAQGQENVTDCVVRNCVIYRPLQGIAVRGELSTTFLDDPTFINRTRTTGVVVGAKVYNNEVYRARGNAYLLQGGVWDCEPTGNQAFNCLYTAFRIYNTVLGSRYINNLSFQNIDYLKSTFNDTDLGYFRTDDTSKPAYKQMRQSGIGIGSGFSDGSTTGSEALGGNIQNCGAIGNKITIKGTMSAVADIIDLENYVISPIFLTRVHSGITLECNDLNGSVAFGISCYNPSSNTSLLGITKVDVSCNAIRNVQGIPYFAQAQRINFEGNTLFNCVHSETQGAIPTAWVRLSGNNNRIKSNTFTAGPQTLLAQPRYHMPAQSINTWIDSNALIGAFTGSNFLSPVGTTTIYGNNAPKSMITLLNGWANFTATPSLSDNLGFTVSEDGEVEISGFLNGAASTADQIGVVQLPSAYPLTSKFSLAFIARDSGPFVSGDTSYSARVQQTDGAISLQRNGDLPPSVYVSFNYRALRSVPMI